MAIGPWELSVAIRSNQIDFVKDYLERGGDSNATLEARIIAFDGDELLMLEGTDVTDSHLTLLHIAVLNCWNNYGRGQASLGILDDLVEHGAQLHTTARFLSANKGSLHSPLSLAQLLKNHLNSRTRIRVDVIDSVIDILRNVPTAIASVSVRKPIATVPVPVYKNLLFSADHSDVTFVCEDGEMVPAHKAILASSSPYFAAAFQGPWAENSPNGEWKTSYTSPVIKAVLSFMYTGDIDILREKPIDMFLIAAYYDIAHLRVMAVAYCIATISVENFKEMLQLAHLYDNVDLKKACYEYAKKNPVSVLTNPDVMNLPTENAAMWTEFKSAIASESN